MASAGQLKIRIDVVRHGETEANAEKVVAGEKLDQPLNETGRAQCAQLSEWLVKKDTKYTDLIYSFLKRTTETTALIFSNSDNKLKGASFCDHGATKELREPAFGEFEGMPYAVYRKAQIDSGKDFFEFVAPGGESLMEMFIRVVACFKETLQKIEQRHAQNGYSPETPPHLLIVAHGFVNGAILKYIKTKFEMSTPEGAGNPLKQPNTSISRFILTGTDTKGKYTAEHEMLFASEHLGN